MKTMNTMKGLGAVVIACQLNPQTAVNLVRFRDGSWGITKSDTTIGVWEREELDECFRAFALQLGITDPHAEQTVLIRVRCLAESNFN
jgi:hypothetical protein